MPDNMMAGSIKLKKVTYNCTLTQANATHTRTHAHAHTHIHTKSVKDISMVSPLSTAVFSTPAT